MWYFSAIILPVVLFAALLGYVWGFHSGLCFVAKYNLPAFYKERCQ